MSDTGQVCPKGLFFKPVILKQLLKITIFNAIMINSGLRGSSASPILCTPAQTLCAELQAQLILKLTAGRLQFESKRCQKSN